MGLATLIAVAASGCSKRTPDTMQVENVGQTGQFLAAGTWTTGNTKTATAGSNRALVVTVHTEGGATVDNIAGVTYGGVPMTEVEDEGLFYTGASAYTAIYVLKEAGIAAATSSTIASTWLVGPGTTPTYNSAIFTDVDQTVTVGDARTSAEPTANPTTLPLGTKPGDMVIFATTNGASGAAFTPAAGYTEVIDATGYSSYRHAVIQKMATGTSETPLMTSSSGLRTTGVGFTLIAYTGTCTPAVACGGATMECGVDSCGTSCGTCPANETCSGNVCNPCVPAVACGGAMECGADSCGNSCGTCTTGQTCTGNACVSAPGGDATLLDTWTVGNSHTVPAGTNRALVVTVHSEAGATADSLSGVTFGGQPMTKIDDGFQLDNGSTNYTAIYVLKETGIAAASGSTIALTWATGPGNTPTITSAVYGNVNQSTVYTSAKAKVGTSAAAVATSSLINNTTDMVIYAVTNQGTSVAYAPGNSFAEQLDAGGSTFRYSVGQKRGSGSPETPSVTAGASGRNEMIAFVLPGSGGSTPPPAPTCSDGVKNGTETGVDCGGPCPACSGETYVTTFFTSSGDLPIQFGATEVTSTLTALPNLTPNANKTLAQLGTSTDPVRIAIGTKNDSALIAEITQAGGAAVTGLLPEGYAIRRTVTTSPVQETYYVVGNDDAGAMYGALEIAESLRLNGFAAIPDSLHNPKYEKRALKMNVPLDARTPSYADGGDAAQAGIEDVWDINFWKAHLDEMARDRFNALSMWTLNPFPSMVQDVVGFENVDLDGPVKKLDLATFDLRAWRCGNTNIPCMMTGDKYANSGATMWDAAAMSTKLKNLTLATAPATMAAKVQFWKDVMQYAANRGVEWNMMTWNIFPAIAENQYNITSDRINPDTVSYYRKAVTKLLETYPLLKGLGWSSGENISGTTAEKGQWITDTYGQGFKDYLATNPTRDFRAICRSWQGSMGVIKTNFTNLGLVTASGTPTATYPNFKLDFSFKYSAARLYSRTAHTLHRPTGCSACATEAFATTDNVWWELRNDDIFMVRWADADFVRAVMQNFPRSGLGGPAGSQDPLTRGFHMGSDGFFWSKDFNSVDATLKGQLQMKKRWAEYYLWGQLAYNPSLTNAHFQNVFRQKYAANLSTAQADKLLTLLQKASQVIPKINSYRWIDWDFQFNPETNASKASGFHKVDNSKSWNLVNAATTVTEFNAIKTAIDADIASIPTTTPELQYTVGDIKAMALLAAYYAKKIEAGQAYGTNNTLAATHLETARTTFGLYRDQIKAQYGAKHILGRAGYWDLDEIYNYHTCYDIKVANPAKVCP